MCHTFYMVYIFKYMSLTNKSYIEFNSKSIKFRSTICLEIIITFNCLLNIS